MAAPTLQEVLACEPQLAGAIDAMNELAPGVPANKGNLATLLGHLEKEGRIDIDTGREKPRIIILVHKHRKQHEILANLCGPHERWYPGRATGAQGRAANEPLDTRPCIEEERFLCTGDGLLGAIVWAKHALKRLREGVCPDCRNAEGERPFKRLKAEGLDRCWHCVIKAAVEA
jgi:hypothetical protein